jgi:hypothetical protein
MKLREDEKIIYKSRGVLIKSRFKLQQGKFILTNQRIVFTPNKLPLFIFGGIIGAALATRKTGLEIERAEILDSERTNFVISGHQIVIKTKERKSYKLVIMNRPEKWFAEL